MGEVDVTYMTRPPHAIDYLFYGDFDTGAGIDDHGYGYQRVILGPDGDTDAISQIYGDNNAKDEKVLGV